MHVHPTPNPSEEAHRNVVPGLHSALGLHLSRVVPLRRNHRQRAVVRDGVRRKGPRRKNSSGHYVVRCDKSMERAVAVRATVSLDESKGSKHVEKKGPSGGAAGAIGAFFLSSPL